MNIKDYAKDVNLSVAEVLRKCDELGIKADGNSILSDDDIIMISQSGIVIRIETSSVRICNRPSKGVTLMRIGEDDKVVTIATTPHENEEEAEKVDNEESNENSETTDTVENNENTENTEE